MNILLTNDDGIDAPGLNILFERLLLDGHKVCAVAPSGNRSGASNSVTIGRELHLEKRDENRFALDGTPVDCVISAVLGKYIPFAPDIVFSGINNGANLGTDILYSGTCGAARQASLYGFPAVALSVIEKDDAPPYGSGPVYMFEPLADFAAKNIEKCIALLKNSRNTNGGEEYPYFLNINAPSIESYKGAGFSSPCRRDYGDTVELRTGSDGRLYSSCVGGNKVRSSGADVSDSDLVSRGCVSVSVLHVGAVANSRYDGWF